MRLSRSALALLRPALAAVVVLSVYYLVPLDGAAVGPLVALGIGLVALAGLLVWQIRSILSSTRPRLRAIEAFATAVPFFLVLFASVYVGMSRSDPASFTEALDRTDALYLAVTVLATVGFGDITPVTSAARVALMVQMVCGLVLLGGVLRTVLGAVQVSLNRDGDESADGDRRRRAG